MRLALIFAAPAVEAGMSFALALAAACWTMRLIAPPI